MVKRILSFVGKEISGLHEAAYLLALSSIASLLFALVRDRLLAHTLGASSSLDVYYAAFRVPDFIFVTIASLVATSILVPFFIESMEKGEEELKKSIQSLFSAFFLLIMAVCTVAYFLLPWLSQVLYPNLFQLGFGKTLITTSRLMLLSPIFFGFASFFASITQIKNRFLVYALAYPLYNVGIILGIIFFLPRFGVPGLAMGVVLGVLLLSFTQIPLVVRDGLFPKLTFCFDWQRVKKVAILSVPRTITVSSQQLTNLGLVSFASFLGAGSISIFNLALNLQSVPLSIIGASYSSAAFPVLAKLMAENNREAFLAKMISVAKHVIFWSIPIAVLFIVLRAQIVRTALGSGEFSWSDTKLTAAALALFIVSSFAQCLVLLFLRAFYAKGETAKPLILNVVSMITTVLLAFGLVKIFHALPVFAFFLEAVMKTVGVSDSSVLMLPLAFTLGSLINLCLHWRSFARDFPSFSRPVLVTLWRSLSASIIGGYVTFWSLKLFDDVFNLTIALGVFLQGLCAGILGIVAMVIILKLLRSPEIKDIERALLEKVWKIDRTSLDRFE